MLFSLNFEGTYDDSEQDISPSIRDYCTLDTSKYYSGSSSLEVVGMTTYAIPNIPDEFTFSCAFQRPTTIPAYMGIAQILTTNAVSAGSLSIFLTNTAFVVWIRDSEGEWIAGTSEARESFTMTISPNEWHTLLIEVVRDEITISVDETEIKTWTASVTGPFSGAQTYQIYNGSYPTAYWIDDVQIDDGVSDEDS